MNYRSYYQKVGMNKVLKKDSIHKIETNGWIALRSCKWFMLCIVKNVLIYKECVVA